ncbi:unnamed protein product, partial [Coregonus sp. 'balchen']
MSTFVDHFVKPWVISLPTRYANISHQGSLEALKFYLNECPPKTLPSTNYTVDLAELFLTS